MKSAIQYIESRNRVLPVDPFRLKEEDHALRSNPAFDGPLKKAFPKGKKLSPKIQTDAKAAAFERIESEKALVRMGDEP